MHKTQLIDVFSGKSTIEYFTNEDKEMMERYKIASQPFSDPFERFMREREAHKEMMERYKIVSQPVHSLAEHFMREREAHEKTMELLRQIASKPLPRLPDIMQLHEPRASSKLLDEPRASSKLLDEPRASSKLLHEPRASSKLLHEPMVSSRLQSTEMAATIANSRRQYKAAELLNKQILAKEIISPTIQLKIEKEKNEQLEKENAQLKKENAQLKRQLHEYQSQEQLLEAPHEYKKDTLEQQNISQYMSQIGKKGNANRGAIKRKIIAHFQREHAETNISKNQFADKYHATYHRTRDTVRNILKGI